MEKIIDLNANNKNLGKLKVYDNKQVSVVFETPLVDKNLVDKICNNLDKSLGLVNFKGVSFAEGVKKIGDDSFKGRQINTLKVRSSVLESIGDRAFQNCGIEKMDLDWKNVYREDRGVFLDENYGLRKIGDKAFANNDISSLDVPPTVEHLGLYAFSYNDKLRETRMIQELEVLETTFYDDKNNTIVIVPATFKRSELQPTKQELRQKHSRM